MILLLQDFIDIPLHCTDTLCEVGNRHIQLFNLLVILVPLIIPGRQNENIKLMYFSLTCFFSSWLFKMFFFPRISIVFYLSFKSWNVHLAMKYVIVFILYFLHINYLFSHFWGNNEYQLTWQQWGTCSPTCQPSWKIDCQYRHCSSLHLVVYPGTQHSFSIHMGELFVHLDYEQQTLPCHHPPSEPDNKKSL